MKRNEPPRRGYTDKVTVLCRLLSSFVSFFFFFFFSLARARARIIINASSYCIVVVVVGVVDAVDIAVLLLRRQRFYLIRNTRTDELIVSYR